MVPGHEALFAPGVGARDLGRGGLAEVFVVLPERLEGVLQGALLVIPHLLGTREGLQGKGGPGRGQVLEGDIVEQGFEFAHNVNDACITTYIKSYLLINP